MATKLKLHPDPGEDEDKAIDELVEFLKGKSTGLIETDRHQMTVEVSGAQHGLYHDARSEGFNVEEV